MSFGVQSENPFMMLLKEDDPDAPKAAPKAKEPAAKPVKKVVEKATEKADTNGSARGNRDGANRGRGNNRGRGGRGGRPGSGRAPREGKREYDRHESGTGRDRHAKKGGAGKYNWGTDQDQAQQGDRAERPRRERRDDRRRGPRNNDEKKPAAEKTEGEETTEPAAEGEEKPKEEPKEEEPEDKTIGYDEYLEELKKKQAELDGEKQLRVVENDESQWKSCAAPTPKRETNEDGPETYAYENAGKKVKGKKKNKKSNKIQHLDEFVGANPQRRARGGRGGRGRGGRGGNSRKFDLNETSNDFPVLGK